MSTTTPAVTVRKVAGRIGAELLGVRLSDHLDAQAVQEIREALVAHKVVFFRGQDHLDDRSQAGFARLLGPLTTAHPTVPSLEGHDDVLNLDFSEEGRAANSWHTDVTFVDQPPAFSVLRSVEVPAYGGDTVWGNTASAYEELPEELRALADRLWALHTNDFDYARLGATKEGVDERRAEYARVFASTKYETVHPVVRIHPESGERSLLLGHFVRQILGFSAAESSALYEIFQRHVTRPENTVRWNWSLGDVAIWDNRATQHYGVGDFHPQRRVMRRVTIAGERPVSINGEPSESRLGDASHYYQTAA
ncbi:MAG: TauD/TfdA family dioxygenase [Acidimicrobiaceae bacterium]|nr:TauD/TfdA family dioxygenase [Acidimicrobiaceae bacterium]